jgi:cation transport ATPase
MGLAAVDRVETVSPVAEIPVTESRSLNIGIPETAADRFLNLKWQVTVAGFCALNLLLAKIIISLDYFASIQPIVGGVWATLLIILSTMSLAFCLPPLATAAFRDLKDGTCSVEVCKAAMLALAAFATVYALFFDFSRLSHQMLYEALPWLVFALTVEQYLFSLFEHKATENSDFNLLRLCQKVRRLEPYPDHAPVEALVSADVIKPGELFKLGVGEFVPCDGIIMEGIAELRERKYSGLPTVKFKSKGNRIFAGSEIVQGEVLCEAASLSDDSTITSFTHILNERIRQSNDKFEVAKVAESRLTVIAFVIAICVGTYVSGSGQNLGVVASLLAGVLSVGLLLRAPKIWAYLPGLIHTTAFRKGMLFKDSTAIDTLSGLRSFIVDFSIAAPPGRMSVKAFEIVDDRVQKEGLIAVLLALFGGSDDELYAVMTEHLRSLVASPGLLKASDVRSYEGRGLCGSVGGIDFTAGSETFLIERGVHIQGSELLISSEHEQHVYIAMQDEVVARFVVSEHFSADAAQMQGRLSDLGIRSILCSRDSAEEVDKIGKRAGFELANIFGGLNEEQYLERVTSTSPNAILTGDLTPPSIAKIASSTVSFFDDIRWNLSRSDVVLLIPNLARISEMFLIAYLSRSVRFTGFLLLALSLGIAAGFAVWGLVTAGLIAPIVILGLLCIYLNHFRLLLP